ncbi:acyltransferase [Pseudomonadota bacterium]|nr:acyltransferase [Pseudomonadota bacterium]
MHYRAEIDGLRALAVLPVILFHAGFDWFSGGFVGVDVFFVISGYLITTILIEDIEYKRFSITNFYERRARRILPALSFVMFVCIPFAWIWMLPNQMKDFSQSLVAVSLFVSNIFFWKDAGYFSTEADEKPLLHSWSLAVEEQYYLLFPIFLILAWRFGKNRVFWMIVVMAALSLLLSEWGWRNKAVANFYLTPTRAWELFAGSIGAFIVQKEGVRRNNPLALFGLAAIIFSIFAYDENTPLPSIYALVPVLGTVLLILYAGKETLVAKLLSIKVFVGIGLISYSAYLWHQPLFAFARIRLLEHPSLFLMVILSALSIILAYLSWRYIEKPFRNKTAWNQKEIFVASVFVILIFSLIGIFGDRSNGFQNRFSQDDLSYLKQINKSNPGYVIKRFNELKYARWDIKKKKVFLVGDSYAQDLANAVYESNLDKKVSLSTYYISAECGNLLIPFKKKKKFTEKQDLQQCEREAYFNNEAFKERLTSADEIWFASSWQPWQVERIKNSIENVQESSTAIIRIFGRKDFPTFKLRKYLGLSSAERAMFVESVKSEKIFQNVRFSELSKDYNFIDVQSLMCGGSASECKIFDSFGYIKTFDGKHLTKSGARFYGERLKETVFISWYE